MDSTIRTYDLIIIGGGAAGLLCAITAAERGLNCCVIEKNKKMGAKILISGGGRCNFTNLEIEPRKYISENPHFMKSALSRYGCWDFIDILAQAALSWHEKKLGQLFCDQKATAVLEALIARSEQAGAHLQTGTRVGTVRHQDDGQYLVNTNQGDMLTHNLVVATGGLSIPKMGATGFAYDLAEKFGLTITPCKPGLVPFTFEDEDREFMASLTGLSIPCVVSCGKTAFEENLLFTHRGLSGPAILQISSYWNEGDSVAINLLPGKQIDQLLQERRKTHPKQAVHTFLSEFFPNRFAKAFAEKYLTDKILTQCSNADIEQIRQHIHNWTIFPEGTEGYRTAEVTVGGVSTNDLSSKTMESKNHKGLYFIGECVDVTGWLGGYNFQWAWASGFAAGSAVSVINNQ